MINYNEELIRLLPFKVFKADFDRLNKGVILNSLDVVIQIVFSNNSITHHQRLQRFTAIYKLALRKKIIGSQAFALGQTSVVLKELGQLNKAIKTAKSAIIKFQKVDNMLFSSSGLILCYSILGKSYNQLGLFQIGLDQFEKAIKLLKNIKMGIPAFRVYEGISECYGALGNQEKTFYYLNMCLQIVNNHIKIPENILATKIPILLKIAVENRKLTNYHKCIKFLNMAENAIDIFNEDIIYREQLQRELSVTYLKIGKFTQAKNCIKEAIILNEKQKNSYKIIESKCLLGKLMIEEGQHDEALKIFLSILNSDNTIENKQLLAMIHQNLSKLYEEKKNLKKIVYHLKIYSELLNNNYKEKHDVLAKNKEETVDQLMLELNLVHKEKENQRLQMEVDHKNRELTSKALFSAANRSFVEDLKSQVKNGLEKNELLKLCDYKITETQDWLEFENRFNEVHPLFLQKLNYKSSLSPLEIRVCTLIKMEFNSPEIAGLLWISKRGVEQHRYRIRKKLQIKMNLYTYISSL